MSSFDWTGPADATKSFFNLAQGGARETEIKHLQDKIADPKIEIILLFKMT